MIVIGAKGLAKELLQIFHERGETENLFFYDDISVDTPEKLFGQFPVLRSVEEVRRIFFETNDVSFCLGLGNPKYRLDFYHKFTALGGKIASTISMNADIGSFDTIVGEGANILSGVVVTNNVKIGRGCLINPNCTISHDSKVGDFVEISPGVSVTGNCQIGDFSVLGTNCTILPGVKIGSNVIVGAGAVVTSDVGDDSLVVGIPAILKKKLTPLSRSF
jgi:sugar O-acyltransferase (sialic acid O-acetyltransferase NeuD family)